MLDSTRSIADRDPCLLDRSVYCRISSGGRQWRSFQQARMNGQVS